MKLWKDDTELFDIARRELFTALVGDVLDKEASRSLRGARHPEVRHGLVRQHAATRGQRTLRMDEGRNGPRRRSRSGRMAPWGRTAVYGESSAKFSDIKAGDTVALELDESDTTKVLNVTLNPLTMFHGPQSGSTDMMMVE